MNERTTSKKRKAMVVIVLSLMLVGIVFSAIGCSANSGKGKIESINGYKTIYRYKVESVLLLNDESSTTQVLQELKGKFKYYYSLFESNHSWYIDFNITWENELQYYFPTLTMAKKTDGYTNEYICNEYQCRVRVRLILDSLDKEYRPSYKANGELVTISYYQWFDLDELYHSGTFAKPYINEIDYDEYMRINQEGGKKWFELRNDEEAQEKYAKELEEKYKYYVCVHQSKVTINKGRDLVVEYHD